MKYIIILTLILSVININAQSEIPSILTEQEETVLNCLEDIVNDFETHSGKTVEAFIYEDAILETKYLFKDTINVSMVELFTKRVTPKTTHWISLRIKGTSRLRQVLFTNDKI